MISLEHVEVGDTVVRVLAGIRMELKVSKVEEDLVHCGDWQFERNTGIEFDPDLHWGSRWGMSGSFIIEVKRSKHD